MKVAPYGTWDSLISAEDLTKKSKSFFDTVGDGEYVYNVEMRPDENGRNAIVRYAADGSKQDMLPMPYNARTRVHEYGGRAFTVHSGVIYFANFVDQNLYIIQPGMDPKELTHNIESNHVRFAELNMTDHGLLAVAERHFDKDDSIEAKNFIAMVDPRSGEVATLVEGSDFYAFPTFNKTGTRLAWISWNHPNMPWDDTQLWVADFIEGKVTNAQQIVNGSEAQSFYQPLWDEDDDLIFIADGSNWWNPYRWNACSNTVTRLIDKNVEFAGSLWNLGMSTWGFFDDLLVFTFSEDATTKIAIVDPYDHPKDPYIFNTEYNSVKRICLHNGALYFVGGSATKPNELVCLKQDGAVSVLARSSDIALPMPAISIAQPIEFPTASRQQTAHAYFYPPVNPEYSAPTVSKPPLIVFIHGGPTSCAINSLALDKQYWTSRGFAVADVDYGGSSGYGRKYRKALQRDNEAEPGYWGEIDVNDCIACVQYLVAQGLVDPDKVVIRGGSAGGYTTLAALASSSVFKAGTSLYGVSDILALAKDTHKFESRYMDQLVGALPKFESIYNTRSPINNLDGFTAPLLVLQGDEDKIVPPNQAEVMVNALRKRGIYVEYKLYAGEQHGFRKSSTIVDVLTTELAFYRKVFSLGEQHEVKSTVRARLSS